MRTAIEVYNYRASDLFSEFVITANYLYFRDMGVLLFDHISILFFITLV